MDPRLHMAATAAVLTDKAKSLVSDSPIHLYVPRAVSALLQVHKT